ncbi:fatty acid desaturase family protein [Stenotrophobium rhamnosiphilum]|uniref:Acyl-CoA desaturase n=1 Tax=Stenotrophobium rhamnosiphilum TaxID=2029166 RepID=A0A2T5MKS9_9GAMM|nr:acyl-CoA desaturase [Stenotrophobium rhamnosiphilum]PTU33182.1 acyl-CoA desaturase [Stenotrophobium rhamnosiphilum]
MGMPTHLSAGDIEEFGREMDAIRNEVMDSRGAEDRAYILKIIRWQRSLALGGRIVMFLSLLLLPAAALPYSGWPQFLLVLGFGGAMLGIAKIVENMEIGHNVMHAQWDWMRDPNIQSNTWEWDNVCPSDQWKHSHNVVHHTWTNVLGKDPDVGYGVMRVTAHQRWKPKYLFQPITNFLLNILFQWGVAIHDLEVDKILEGKKSLKSAGPLLRRIAWKAVRQLRKDYLLWPALGSLLTVPVTLFLQADVLHIALLAFAFIVAGNALANLMRNVWSNIIIFCGHFPIGVHHFTKEEVEGETRARWYVRQLLGSANIGGGKLFHILSGNLSHQIEHHIFPDMPSNRYPQVSPRVKALADRYGLPYNTGSLTKQFGTTTWTIWRLAFPGGRITASTLPAH